MDGECGGRYEPPAEPGMGNRDFTIKKRHTGVPPAAELIGLINRGLTRSFTPQFDTSVCYQRDDTIFYHI
jgi:hypothetical protein